MYGSFVGMCRPYFHGYGNSLWVLFHGYGNFCGYYLHGCGNFLCVIFMGVEIFYVLFSWVWKFLCIIFVGMEILALDICLSHY